MAKAKKNAESEQIAEYVGHMTKGMNQFIKTKEEKFGKPFAHALAVDFMTSFVAALVLDSLNDLPPELKSKDAKMNRASSNFKGVKLEVANSVAVGISQALGSFSGRSLEYFCYIKQLPEGTSKLPC
jgi:hypothetical protein